MKYLIDTHVLLWAAGDDERLPRAARKILTNSGLSVAFSVASLWEICIKNGLGRSDFVVDARDLRHGLLDQGFEELPIRAEHVLAVQALPARHKDPFDRLLLAQAIVEGRLLLTSDKTLAQYPGPVQAI